MAIRVRTFWDGEAGVWVAESADVPGLATEAASLDALKAKLDVMIPELLEANGALPRSQSAVQVTLTVEFAEPVAPVPG